MATIFYMAIMAYQSLVLTNTLQAKGAWPQVARIEDLCHTHVSDEWFCDLDACVGNDFLVNVQKTIGQSELRW